MKHTATLGIMGVLTVLVSAAAAAPKEEARTSKDGFPQEKMPLVLYEDCKPGVQPIYAPSGWMGATENIEYENCCTDNPRGTTCIKFTLTEGEWAGVVWQYPANDWGDIPDGLNLTAARRLTFWARGERGGEQVEFKMGVLGRDKPYPDSGSAGVTTRLSKQWKQYSVALSGKNLKCIKTGFSWSLRGRSEPVTMYVDDIRYE